MFTFNLAGLVIMLVVFAIEIFLTLRHSSDHNLIKDVSTNVLLGVLYIGSGVLAKGMAFGLYSFLYHKALFAPPLSWWLWLIGFLGCEFCHYAYHWLGHKTKLFWAAHVTHHSSEYFNMSTGFRSNFIHIFYRFIFWSPLCWLGIPPEMVLLMESLTGIHNFLLHTERIGKLGWLDVVFNTLSSHRVHHGKNAAYIDKNLGGITHIFDHLFGTYVKESEIPVYGITHELPGHDAATIILHEYHALGTALHEKKGAFAKLKFLLSPPE